MKWARMKYIQRISNISQARDGEKPELYFVKTLCNS